MMNIMNVRNSVVFLFLSLFFAAVPAWGQRIIYVYPSGGQKGTSFEIIISGQQVMRAKNVSISGEGVQTEILEGGTGFRLNESNERYVISLEFLKAIKRAYGEDQFPRLINPVKPKDTDELLKLENIAKRRLWINRLSDESLFQNNDEAKNFLQRFYYEYYMPRPDRFLPVLTGNLLSVRVTIDPNAKSGWRNLTLTGPQGISNTVPFQITSVPEICEKEPNDPGNSWIKNIKKNRPNNPKQNEKLRIFFKDLPTQNLPVIFNGQIRAGDADRFHFNAKKGQKLILACWGRFLSPYLADAVPGWFAPVITLLDPQGKELKTADSWRFDPDPVMLFEVPESGSYTVDIQDSLFRGRDDFVYRLAIGEFPFVTSTSSLGPVDSKKTIALSGWNLPVHYINPESASKNAFNNNNSSFAIDQLNGRDLLYPIILANESLPVVAENEAPKILTLPLVIDGKISKPNELDSYHFSGKKGDKIVLDVSALRFGSSIDAKVELYDSQNNLIGENDDRADEYGPNIGLETHHADPYLLCELPKNGIYTVRLFNILNQGGPEYGYRLRISKPMPDFEVYAYPSVVRFRSGNEILQLTAVRKDGFNEKIEINSCDIQTRRSDDTLKLSCYGASIPAGADRVVCSVNVEGQNKTFIPCDLTATAIINGKKVTHRIIPADNLEQAFIYHHLIPQDHFYILKNYRSMPSLIMEPDKQIVFKNGSADLDFQIAQRGTFAYYLRQLESERKKTNENFKSDSNNNSSLNNNRISVSKNSKVNINTDKDSEDQKINFPKVNKKRNKINNGKNDKNPNVNNKNNIKTEQTSVPEFEFSVISPKNIAIDHWELKDKKLSFKLKIMKTDDKADDLPEKANLVIALMTPQLPSKDPTKKKVSNIREYLPAVTFLIEKQKKKTETAQ